MESRKEIAIRLFKEGYNCSQSVFGAFADLYGIDQDTALRLSASFGGGMGRMREVCGAVSGMMMVAGLETGAVDGKDVAGKQHNYEVVQELAATYREKNGSIICRELLGLEGKLHNNTKPEERTAQYYKKRPCVNLVADAVEVLEDYLMREKSFVGNEEILTVKQVKEEEQLKAVATLANTIWHEFFPCILTEEQIDYMVEKFQSEKAMKEQVETQGYLYYQILLGDQLIGYTGIKPEEKKLFLSKLYLAKEARGKGYASKVFSFLERVGKELGCQSMYLTVNRHNDNSVAVYHKRGFVTIEERVTDIGNGFVMDDFVMEKVF